MYSLKNSPSGELNITEKYRWYVNGARQVIASKKEIILNSYCSFRDTHLWNLQNRTASIAFGNFHKSGRN